MENEPKKEITLDDLARIVQERFDGVDSNIKNLQIDVSELKSDVSELKTDVSGMKDSITNIEAEVMKKIDRFTHKDLEFRVEKLEKLSKKYA